jgi:hypothetical protein
MSFHASQESRGFVAGSKGEYQLVGEEARPTRRAKFATSLAGDTFRRPEERAYQHIQSNYQNTDQFSLFLFKVVSEDQSRIP